jgi:hypothetical protein
MRTDNFPPGAGIIESSFRRSQSLKKNDLFVGDFEFYWKAGNPGSPLNDDLMEGRWLPKQPATDGRGDLVYLTRLSGYRAQK